ncbi:MAG: DUF547 domain-containing protein [Alphaproteobacteria bacterium]|nr:DUF547 domain-containing protein [Alphaproteobacteria bacterium]
MLPLFALTLACTQRIEPSLDPPARDPSAAWASVLDSAVSKQGVDYDLIRQRERTLDRYLAWVGKHGPRKDQWGEKREDRSVAFLLNAYNAAVIKGVLAQSDGDQRIGSVKDVRAGVFPAGGPGFFVGQRFRVDGEWMSLHHLESELIVNRYQEPLLHVALNCASASCPPLQIWPAGKRKLQPALKRAMRQWVATDDALRIDGALGADGLPERLLFNEIFSWYADDFTDWSEADTVCAYLVDFAVGPRKKWLEAHADDCPMDVFPYDWSLNHATRPDPGTELPDEEEEVEEEEGADEEDDSGEPHG